MKTTFLAILLTAILVFSIPATTVAAAEGAHTVSGIMSVHSTDRSKLVYDFSNIGNGIIGIAGPVTYAGTVDSASGGAWASLRGATLTVNEQVSYQVSAITFNILPGQGSAKGSLVINSKTGGAVKIAFTSVVTGNVAGYGPAIDNGTWHVTNTTKGYDSIDDSHGTWIATMTFNPTTGVFSGPVAFAGTTNDNGKED